MCRLHRILQTTKLDVCGKKSNFMLCIDCMSLVTNIMTGKIKIDYLIQLILQNTIYFDFCIQTGIMMKYDL